ncbi:hypothetical protein F4X86_02060 [Candidatus Saccharibacteria bacterium]|nr:hypothetical protein [Candidatus Saccharibacteria bacterium]
MPEALFDFTDEQPEDNIRQGAAGREGSRLAKVVPLGAAAVAETRPDPFEPPGPTRRERLDRLRQSAAYRRRLKAIKAEFDFDQLESGMGLCDRDIPAPDLKRLNQWLEAHGSYLDQLAGRDGNLYQVDKAILRTELRRLVTQMNSDFSDRIGALFPGSRDLEIERPSRLRQRPRKGGYRLPRGRMRVYENKPTIVILNSVGCNALLGASSYEVRCELLQKNINEDRPADRRSLSLGRAGSTSLYDLLPGQFLLARIWAVRSLCDFIDLRQVSDSPRQLDFLGVADCFQNLNLEARALLNRSGRPVDASFEQKDMPGGTRPVRELERFLLEADWSGFSA